MPEDTRRTMRFTALAVVIVLFALPIASEAQQAGKVYRVGTLFPPLIHQSYRIEEFRQALRDHGYAEGQNLVLDSRPINPDNFYRPDLAKELLGRGVDVIVTMEIAGGQAARHATETTPIVVLNCDPFKLLVASLARPGGNVTGQSCMSAELTPKRLELFKTAIPHLKRVAFLYNPKQPGPTLSLQLAQEAAQSLRITLHPIEVSNVADFEPAFTKIQREHCDGLIVYQDFVTASRRPQIIEFAARSKLPAIYQFRDWVDAGGLISYGANLRAMYRRAGVQVSQILSGVKPADLPIEQPTSFELIINLKAAKALGVTIQPSLLLRADQIIE
jgi:putative ABC transport system substrate-binding protein